MGQAQSMSSGTGTDCGECFGAFGEIVTCVSPLRANDDFFLSHLEGRDDHPDPLKSISSSNNGFPQTQASSTGKYDGGYRPTQLGGNRGPSTIQDLPKNIIFSTTNYPDFQVMIDSQQTNTAMCQGAVTFLPVIAQSEFRTI